MKVLIIGLGKIGFEYDLKKKMFLTHSSAFYFNKKFKLVGAVETNKSKLKLFENRYKAPGFIKIKDALKKLNPDIIVVSVNTKFHLQVIKKIFLCKFKNKIIFCEKPCGNSLSEIREIKKISKKNNTKVFVNYMRNSLSGVNELIKIFKRDKGYFKGIAYYNNNLLNEASHYINLFLKIFGKVTKVKNEIIKSLGKKINNFTLFFNKGEIKFICLNNTSYHNSRFEIFLRSRHINYDSDQDLLNFYGIKKNKIYDNIILSRKTNKIIKLKFKDVQMQVANQFLKRKNHKKFNLVTIDEAIKTMEIIDKLK
jgi:predicted dehydrogenase